MGFGHKGTREGNMKREAGPAWRTPLSTKASTQCIRTNQNRPEKLTKRTPTWRTPLSSRASTTDGCGSSRQKLRVMDRQKGCRRHAGRLRSRQAQQCMTSPQSSQSASLPSLRRRSARKNSAADPATTPTPRTLPRRALSASVHPPPVPAVPQSRPPAPVPCAREWHLECPEAPAAPHPCAVFSGGQRQCRASGGGSGGDCGGSRAAGRRASNAVFINHQHST